MSYQKHTKRGSIIAFTIILLSLLLTSGLSIVSVAALEKRSSLATQKSVVAFQAADSGTERVLEQIYVDNSPSYATVDINDPMPNDPTLDDLAAALHHVAGGATCNTTTNKVTATSATAPAYTFEVSFFDGSDVQISCSDTAWRDKVVRIKTEGFFRQTSRVIELGIKPRPLCGAGDTVDDEDGNTYNIIQIGAQCWMQQNMRVGVMRTAPTSLVTGTLQSNDGIIEKYCHSNQASNCTTNHPNEPDGGLYTWDEAMQYSTTEGAQGICPNGWHIPSRTDWYTLYHHLDPSVQPNDASVPLGVQLAPGGSSGFERNFAGTHNGATTFSSRDISNATSGGSYWTSTERSGNPLEALDDSASTLLGNPQPNILRSRWLKTSAYSIRCVKD